MSIIINLNAADFSNIYEKLTYVLRDKLNINNINLK